jgi:hypothetical protein
MFDREEEENYLAIADRRILDSEKKIQLLMEQIDALKAQGADIKVVLALLSTADEVLITLKTFRAQVLEKLKTGDNP